MQTLKIIFLSSLMLVLAGCSDMGTGQTMGTLTGGAIGGLAGSTIGQGTGNTAAIIGGSVVGAMIGGAAGRDYDQSQ